MGVFLHTYFPNASLFVLHTSLALIMLADTWLLLHIQTYCCTAIHPSHSQNIFLNFFKYSLYRKIFQLKILRLNETYILCFVMMFL
jgi:hypothetical protein